MAWLLGSSARGTPTTVGPSRFHWPPPPTFHCRSPVELFRHRTSLETRSRYSVSDCLLTFPFPSPPTSTAAGGSICNAFYLHRADVGQVRHCGLTALYNLFHDSDENSADIQKLRELHVEMDKAVAAAYAWTDLDLGHGFHQTKQGLRYTISEAARREVLGRLLKLNHERYAEEVAKGLHEKKKVRKSKSKEGQKTTSGGKLFA